MDVEPVDSVHTLQLLESVERDLAGARHELYQLGQLFLVQRTDRSPEPLDLWRSCRVVMILRVALPVVHVDIGQTRDEQLQLLLVEDRDKFSWDDLVESYV